RRHTRSLRDWSSDVCSSDLVALIPELGVAGQRGGQVAGRVELGDERDVLAVSEGDQGADVVLRERGPRDDLGVGAALDAKALVRSEERRVGKKRRYPSPEAR